MPYYVLYTHPCIYAFYIHEGARVVITQSTVSNNYFLEEWLLMDSLKTINTGDEVIEMGR